MAGDKIGVILFVFKKARTAYVSACRRISLGFFRKLPRVYDNRILGISGAHSNEIKRFVRASSLAAKHLVKGYTKLRKKGKRAAKIKDVSLDFAALSQSRNGLVNNGA